jgi:hypothetical protein
MSASVRPLASRAVPLVHRKSLLGFRAACEQLWGERGVQDIGRHLPADVRDRTAGLRPIAEWVPVDDLVSWHNAVWNGPAERNEAVFMHHARTTVDQGFGRVKRFLLSVSTPHSIAPRAASLWREEYSTGRLAVTRLEDRSAELSLSDHPYVDIPLMRDVIAEVYRHVLAQTNVKSVSEVHAVRKTGTANAEGEALVVVLRWT